MAERDYLQLWWLDDFVDVDRYPSSRLDEIFREWKLAGFEEQGELDTAMRAELNELRSHRETERMLLECAAARGLTSAEAAKRRHVHLLQLEDERPLSAAERQEVDEVRVLEAIEWEQRISEKAAASAAERMAARAREAAAFDEESYRILVRDALTPPVDIPPLSGDVVEPTRRPRPVIRMPVRVPYPELGRRLKSLIRQTGLNYDQFAGQAHYAKSQLVEACNGRSMPQSGTLEVLAKTLTRLLSTPTAAREISIRDLTGDEQD